MTNINTIIANVGKRRTWILTDYNARWVNTTSVKDRLKNWHAGKMLPPNAPNDTRDGLKRDQILANLIRNLGGDPEWEPLHVLTNKFKNYEAITYKQYADTIKTLFKANPNYSNDSVEREFHYDQIRNRVIERSGPYDPVFNQTKGYMIKTILHEIKQLTAPATINNELPVFENLTGNRRSNNQTTIGINVNFYNNNRPVNFSRNSNEVKRIFSNKPSKLRGNYPQFYRKVNGKYKLKNNINWNTKWVDPLTNKKLDIHKAFIIKKSRGEPQFFNKSTLQQSIIQQLHSGQKPSNPFNRKEFQLNNITQVPIFIKEDIRKWKVENRRKRGKPTPNLSAKNRNQMMKKLTGI